MRFASRKGLNINVKGAPTQRVYEKCTPESCAIFGEDMPGLRPEFHVSVGDKVRTGQILLSDRKSPDISFASPATGIVKEITDGPKRTLGRLVVEVADDDPLDVLAPEATGERRGMVSLLLGSGLWPSFLARPFGRIPPAGAEPSAIFVTAADSNPLAADPAIVLSPDLALFERGVEALALLTDGPVYVCQADGPDLFPATGRIQVVKFDGPHPSGLPGTHIHRLLPVSVKRTAWHVGYQDVVAIGDLLLNRRYRSKRIIARGGEASAKPCLVETLIGANLSDIARADGGDSQALLLSGSILSGRKSDYLGRYHAQMTMLATAGVAGGRSLPSRLRALATNGSIGQMIPLDSFDGAMPLDILPVPLLRALSVGDTETAVKLGCLELVEEDLALMSYLCPGRTDYGGLLRRMLDDIADQLG
jgi:Na+-transporting NADH:ubiquinone oxidoreductase subunit A